MITKIRKRDGRLADYDITKIENAIAKAMMAIGDGEIKDCKKMARITELNLMEKFEDRIPSVEDVQDDALEISLEDARETKPEIQIGDTYEIPVDIAQFARATAMQVKLNLKQKIREKEKESIYNEYITKKDEIVTGIIEKVN